MVSARAISDKQFWVRRVVKPAVFFVCLGPLAWLVGQWSVGGLGANPIEATNRFLGDWALRFLLITLVVTPAKALLTLPFLSCFRRMLGLFAFLYASLHLTSYVVLDQFFAWGEIWADVVKRTYITIGFAAFLLLVPLAVTSTKGWIRRLGAPRWQTLHRLVYPAAVLAVIHYFMMVKADIREPAIYGVVLAVLLGYRAVTRLRRKLVGLDRRSPNPRTA